MAGNTSSENSKPKTIWSIGKKAYDAQTKSVGSENLNMHFPIQRGVIDFQREE